MTQFSALVKVCVFSSPSNSLYFADDSLGGWANEGEFEFYKEINAQIDQAFENVQSALTAAGGKGWDQVSIRSRLMVEINMVSM